MCQIVHRSRLLRDGHRKYYVPFYRTIKQQAMVVCDIPRTTTIPAIGSLGEGAARSPHVSGKIIHVHCIEIYL